MKLLVLAGGFGTRLKTVTQDVPKALAPVGDAPFLTYQLTNWLAQGVEEFVFLLHHQAEQVIAYLESETVQKMGPATIQWVVEPRPLDTGGAIAYALQETGLSGDFLVTNADTWLGEGIHEMRAATAPALAVVHLEDTGRYGQIAFDESLRVTVFEEKNPLAVPGWINAGLCRLHSSIFRNWDGQPFSLERSVFTAVLRQGCLQAVPLKVDFIDIGIPADYHRFCQWVKHGQSLPL